MLAGLDGDDFGRVVSAEIMLEFGLAEIRREVSTPDDIYISLPTGTECSTGPKQNAEGRPAIVESTRPHDSTTMPEGERRGLSFANCRRIHFGPTQPALRHLSIWTVRNGTVNHPRIFSQPPIQSRLEETE